MSNVIIKPGDQATHGLGGGQQVVGWRTGQNENDPNDGAEYAQQAQETLAILLTAYPGWAWFVEIKMGVCMVRNFDLDPRGRMCMVRKMDKQYSASSWVREITRAGGEFLERANQRRGAHREGDVIKQLEGAKGWRPTPGTK